MARVTTEDCQLHISNPFTLTQVAAKRARQLARGATSQLPFEDHKSTVVALQEIARGLVDASILGQADLPLVEAPKLELDSLDNLL
ncbi:MULTISPECIES: DNA-directed RNA polymerase subunit omega [Hydrocarboniphaga]|jgi:DNA-directed RNA polymerase subunit omega|uniref:DNA-directed RNA polymerase subunit omega n=1 Tax=Hydrocarboniphaga effusa AP103 TaxID=1172194 RepID=I8T3X8_9GAMM|nr:MULTISPECIES: DNA-directed RNA polymerase subunit omega [Hydrocarboniphaga]EIT68620.1 DNA-directed RNA polymerase, omega subunit [Hydrocarboniphaga effusa AP103]MDZ4077028.1 DNA-directed RNA polymerase subunit omega [Hydrocarboniphaga sp.]